MDSQLSLPQGEAGPHTDTRDSDEVHPRLSPMPPSNPV